jgi:hypothetical protein
MQIKPTLTVIVVTLLCALLGCDARRSRTPETIFRDSAGVRIAETPGDLWRVAARWQASGEPAVRIGAVDGNEEYLFDGIWGIVPLEDGRVVVSNSGDGTLRWYGSDGRFLFRRGGSGEGPGEFSRLGELTLTAGDSLTALDWARSRLVLFGLEGELGRTVRIDGLTAPPGRVYRLSTGEWIVGTSGSSTAQLKNGLEPGVFRLDSPILRLDATGVRADTVGVFPSAEVEVIVDGDNRMFGPARFGRRLSYAVLNDEIATGTADQVQIDFHDPSGRLVRSLRAPDVDVRLTPQIEAAYRAHMQQQMMEWPPAERPAGERMLARMTLPALVPAFAHVIVDADERLWLGEYRFDDTPPQRYLVFGADGNFLGLAITPPSVRVMAISNGRLWGRLTDEDGVEYVVAYTLVEA